MKETAPQAQHSSPVNTSKSIFRRLFEKEYIEGPCKARCISIYNTLNKIDVFSRLLWFTWVLIGALIWKDNKYEWSSGFELLITILITSFCVVYLVNERAQQYLSNYMDPIQFSFIFISNVFYSQSLAVQPVDIAILHSKYIFRSITIAIRLCLAMVQYRRPIFRIATVAICSLTHLYTLVRVEGLEKGIYDSFLVTFLLICYAYALYFLLSNLLLFVKQLSKTIEEETEFKDAMMNLSEGILIIDHKLETIFSNKAAKAFLSSLPGDNSATTGRLKGQFSNDRTVDSFSSDERRSNLPGNFLRMKIRRIRDQKELSSQSLSPINSFAGDEDDTTTMEEVLSCLYGLTGRDSQKSSEKEIRMMSYHYTLQNNQEEKAKQFALKIKKISHAARIRFIIVISNTTHLFELTKLRRDDAIKSRLMASVSHELRTPVNGIIAFLSLSLQDGSLQDSVKDKLLKPALNSARLLLFIINDIIDFAQMEKNKLVIIPQYFNLKAKLKEVVYLIEIQAKMRGLQVLLEYGADVPEMILAEPNRLGQIIMNLLSNALKFTLKGYLKVKVRKAPASEMITIEVEDTGVGIKEENMQHLFKLFYKEIDESHGSPLNTQGSGLGLTISQHLAKKLGSTGIKVKSQFGKGTTFWFDLPLKSLPEHGSHSDHEDVEESLPDMPEVPQMTPQNLQSLANRLDIRTNSDFSYKAIPSGKSLNSGGPLVLLVDDNDFNLMSLGQQLKLAGYKSMECLRGKEALSILLKEEIMLVITDIDMPDMNGFQLLAEIRKQEAAKGLKRIPVFAHTALGDKFTKTKCIDVGFDAVLEKPMSITHFTQLFKEKVLGK